MAVKHRWCLHRSSGSRHVFGHLSHFLDTEVFEFVSRFPSLMRLLFFSALYLLKQELQSLVSDRSEIPRGRRIRAERNIYLGRENFN